MDLIPLILKYGYFALFVGTFLEGETIVLIAGFLAQQGYLELLPIILASFLGSFAGDQTAFFVGRHFGVRFLDKREKLKQKATRVFALLDKYQTWIILGFRFLYGVRNVTPFVVGSSGFSPARFFVLNGIGAGVWAISFGLIGYQFGQLVSVLIKRVESIEHLVLGAVVAIFLFFMWRRRRNAIVAKVETSRMSMMSIGLNGRILIGAIAGIALGLLLKAWDGSAAAHVTLAVCGLIGNLFVDLLKMVLMPLVFTSIAVGIANLRANDSMHRVWALTLGYFLTATTIATVLGLSAANLFEPGKDLDLKPFEQAMATYQAKHLTLSEFLTHFLHGLFMNPITAMAQGEVLAVVIFALFVGIGFIVLGDRTRNLFKLTEEFLALIMLIVGWIMELAPLGILALLAKLTATQSPDLLMSLGKFVSVTLACLLIHGFVILPALLFLLTGVTPKTFFPAVREALVTAFATSSSSATLPVTLRCTERNLGVKGTIAGFVVPLGATVNMDGTALYEAAAALFVANLAGVELNLVQQLVVCFTAILASIGAPGIPSAGMVTMVMVLQSVGLPAEAIAILLPVDRLIDAFRTMVNVEGDMIGSLIVQRHAAPKREPA